MAEINLAQYEADTLLAMEKHRVSDYVHTFPARGEKRVFDLQSVDGREQFLLDLYRGRRNLYKVTMHNRARQNVTLVRLDLHGRHTNPDGEVFTTSHLHLYREGSGDKWAMPVPADKFSDLSDLETTLHEFMLFCNITKPPDIKVQRDIF